MSEKRTIVVGHRGQDGRLLRARLEERGDAFLGIDRTLVECSEGGGFAPIDIGDAASVAEAVRSFRPDEIYYLAAHHRSSEGRASESIITEYQGAMRVNVHGLLNFLEAMRQHAPRARLFYASSSLIYGVRSPDERQDESTPWSPVCEYGLTKALGMLACREYREKAGLFAACGILYNHESAFRPPDYLTQKVIRAALRIQQGSQEKLVLGDLDAVVDWSYAPDFVDAFMRILGLDRAEDFVVASGEGHSVRELVTLVFGELGLNWQDHTALATGQLSRQSSTRVGEAHRLRQATGWHASLDFRGLTRRLIEETRAIRTAPRCE